MNFIYLNNVDNLLNKYNIINKSINNLLLYLNNNNIYYCIIYNNNNYDLLVKLINNLHELKNIILLDIDKYNTNIDEFKNIYIYEIKMPKHNKDTISME